MNDTNWLDDLYEKTYNEEILFLQRRLKNCPSLKIDDLKGQLETLYSSQGSDWEGRGEVGNVQMSATIAAYESFISDLEKIMCFKQNEKPF